MSNELTNRMDDLLEQLMYCDFRTEIDIDKAKKLIRLAFRNEQRLAREACGRETDRLFFNTPSYNIDRHSVYQAIINTKAV